MIRSLNESQKMNIFRRMHSLRLLTAAAALLAALPALAADIEVPSLAAGGADLTVYTNNLAMVRERRAFKLAASPAQLAITGVSSQLQPETAFLSVLKGKGVKISEQSFNFDLLSPQKLLERAVGQTVTLINQNPATGADIGTRAKVLSVQGGLVLDVNGKIVTGMPGRIVYDSLPPGVRPTPTLLMSITGPANQDVDAELGYLTGGLSWHPDYVMQYDPDAARMELSALASITNTTGHDFRDAKIKLVAGAVKRVTPQPIPMPRASMQAKAMMMEAAPMADGVTEEGLVGNHVYTIPKATTIASSESKQLALLSAQGVPVKRDFVIRSNDQSVYFMSVKDRPQSLRAEIELTFKNDTASKLGAPLPAGTVRVYSPDAQGAPQFVGEAFLDHVPVGSDAVVKMGQDYDLTATREQTTFVRATDTITLSNWKVTLKNAKARPVTVRVIEPMVGTWEITKENVPHKKVDSGNVGWDVHIPAKGQAVLDYSVKTQS
jgi:hypothetical protein